MSSRLVPGAGASIGIGLDDIHLSNRAKNALTKAGITTVEALQSMSSEDIQNTPGLGEKTIAEILEVLGRGVVSQ